MTDNRGNTVSECVDPSPWKKSMAAFTAFAMTAALGGCAASREPKSLPGERLGVVRVTTIPEGLTVRLLGEVVAGPPALVEQFSREPKIGPSPQTMSVSYKPGFDTQMVVQAFLHEPPEPGERVTLHCEVYADGEIMPGSEDVEIIDERNQQTAFVICVFNENLAPPQPN